MFTDCGEGHLELDYGRQRREGRKMSFLDRRQHELGLGSPCEHGMSLANRNLNEAYSFGWMCRCYAF